jgi:hypothetical protein
VYKLIKILSMLIRYYYVPNPFQTLEWGDIIWLFSESIFFTITFAVVGLFYSSGSNSAWGSFLYLLFYSFHIALVMIMAVFNFNPFISVAILYTYFWLVFKVRNGIGEFNY